MDGIEHIIRANMDSPLENVSSLQDICVKTILSNKKMYIEYADRTGTNLIEKIICNYNSAHN